MHGGTWPKVCHMRTIVGISYPVLCDFRYVLVLIQKLGARRCNCPTDSWKFPTPEIMGASQFDFAPKSPKMEDFLTPNFVFWRKKIRQN